MAHVQPLLELKTRPRFCPANWSLSMLKHSHFKNSMHCCKKTFRPGCGTSKSDLSGTSKSDQVYSTPAINGTPRFLIIIHHRGHLWKGRQIVDASFITLSVASPYISKVSKIDCLRFVTFPLLVPVLTVFFFAAAIKSTNEANKGGGKCQ